MPKVAASTKTATGTRKGGAQKPTRPVAKPREPKVTQAEFDALLDRIDLKLEELHRNADRMLARLR